MFGVRNYSVLVVHWQVLVEKIIGSHLGVNHIPQTIAGQKDDSIVGVDVEVRHVRLGTQSVPVVMFRVKWVVR